MSRTAIGTRSKLATPSPAPRRPGGRFVHGRIGHQAPQVGGPGRPDTIPNPHSFFTRGGASPHRPVGYQSRRGSDHRLPLTTTLSVRSCRQSRMRVPSEFDTRGVVSMAHSPPASVKPTGAGCKSRDRRDLPRAPSELRASGTPHQWWLTTTGGPAHDQVAHHEHNHSEFRSGASTRPPCRPTPSADMLGAVPQFPTGARKTCNAP